MNAELVHSAKVYTSCTLSIQLLMKTELFHSLNRHLFKLYLIDDEQRTFSSVIVVKVVLQICVVILW